MSLAESRARPASPFISATLGTGRGRDSALGQATEPRSAWQEFYTAAIISPLEPEPADSPSRSISQSRPTRKRATADVLLALSRYDSALAVLRAERTTARKSVPIP